MAWPRWNAMPRTWSGVMVCASTRGDGWLADQVGQARHPAALLVDTDRKRQRVRRGGDVGQRVAHHRQVGPAADHDAADVLVVDDGAGVVDAGDPDHQQLRQLVADRHRRQHVTAGRWDGAAGSGCPARCSTGCGDCIGLLGGGRARQQQAGHRRENTEYTGEGHGVMLSWRYQAVTRCSRSHVSLARMDRFLVPAAASIVVGLLLGAAAIFGITLMVQQDTKPPVQAGDPASAVLNRVEYGDRS